MSNVRKFSAGVGPKDRPSPSAQPGHPHVGGTDNVGHDCPVCGERYVSQGGRRARQAVG